MLELAQQAAGSGMPDWMAAIMGPLGALVISLGANWFQNKQAEKAQERADKLAAEQQARLDKVQEEKDAMGKDLMNFYRGHDDDSS